MATLHLTVGLPCSGKTTFARQLATQTQALLLITDVWHIRLFGDDATDEAHDKRHEIVESLMWDVAEHVLKTGGDVILDFGLWTREDRDVFKKRAADLGAECRLYYMDVPEEELYRRLEERNRNPQEGVFVIPKEYMDRYIPIFEPPSADEKG